MKLSYHWLRDYLTTLPEATIPEPKILSDILTNLGLEVEELIPFTTIRGNLESLVVGYTLKVVPHSNADRLKVCTIDIGNDTPLTIVCGAPNVDKDQKVIVAPVGSTVYPISAEPFTIQKSKIRGEWSEGMLCAEDEIGLGISHEGIRILPSDWEIGKLLTEYIKPYEDWIFEIGITPNRSDALSHKGAARDIKAYLRSAGMIAGKGSFEMAKNLKNSKELNTIDKSSTSTIYDSAQVELNDDPIQIQLDSPNCLRFSGVSINGVQVKESPEWLKNRLTAIGLRSINNIVDITNFICHDLGQPMHAYDASKIKGRTLIARNGIENEVLTTLDGQERKLTTKDLVISDVEKPLGLAGIMGGIDSGVNIHTKNIFLESAYFSPLAIRKTARKFSLKTDASFRFERGTDPENTIDALHYAVKLVLELAGGELISEFLDIYPIPIPRPKIILRQSCLTKIIGQRIDPAVVEEILIGLGILILSKDEETWNLEIPLFKPDVTREADIIEEILRVYGFNKILIPEQIRSSIKPSIKPDPEQIKENLANYLSANGFHEIQTNSLINNSLVEMVPLKDPSNLIHVLHPLSQETNVLRPNMLPSILKAIEYNINRKQADIKFYEFGKIYSREKSPETLEEVYLEPTILVLALSGQMEKEQWFDGVRPQADIYQLKGILQNIFEKLGFRVVFKPLLSSDLFSIGLDLYIENKKIGEMGLLTATLLKNYSIDKEIYYATLNWDQVLSLKKNSPFLAKEISKFPLAQRDLSLLLEESISFEELKKVAMNAKIPILAEVLIFDVYQGNRIPKNKKSYSLRFILGDSTRTLTDLEIEKAMNKLILLFQKEVKAEIPLNS
jgi:phenylalanyl-tRNA synthetase beta chain